MMTNERLQEFWKKWGYTGVGNLVGFVMDLAAMMDAVRDEERDRCADLCRNLRMKRPESAGKDAETVAEWLAWELGTRDAADALEEQITDRSKGEA